jgi:hypothetical protein
VAHTDLKQRSRAAVSAVAIALLIAMSACGASSGPRLPDARDLEAISIMGPNRLTPEQLAAWFSRRTPRPPGAYAATVPVETMARLFVEEGLAEGVAGDVAFVQSVIETGWFRFTGMVPASSNNFAGIGATGTRAPRASFADARTGVRAQIQHLRAYADATASTCSQPPLRNPCVDPRFHFVVPRGKAPTWNQLGNGNWATARAYGASIVFLYLEARAYHETEQARSRSRKNSR